MISDPRANSPLFSIITPVYNGGLYFEELIQSIASQSETSVEHIVIDDGSNDKITKATLKKYPHLKRWSRENKGQYYSMNEGLKKASGKWVCFISADDLIPAGAVLHVKQAIDAHPDHELFWGRSRFIRQDGSRYEVQPILERYTNLYRFCTQIPHSSIYIRRDLLIHNNIRFDPHLKFVGDYDWILRLLANNPRKQFIDQELSYIRLHEGQTTIRMGGKMTLERDNLLKCLKINQTAFTIAQEILSIRSALIRIGYETRSNGPSAGLALIKYFIHHKLSLQ
jgi:glycosyltransferase involved in cell wall biosynthesis